MRFSSWECWDFWRRHDHFRRFLKSSDEVRRHPKSAKGEVIEKTLIHKIRDREEGIVIYSFYTWFSFLTWVWVNIFLEIVSSKTATTHIFQSGVRNWPASASRREIEVFNPQAWELAGILDWSSQCLCDILCDIVFSGQRLGNLEELRRWKINGLFFLEVVFRNTQYKSIIIILTIF